MFFGVYRGVVVDSDTVLMRIKAQVPMVLGQEISEWASPCVPPGWSRNLVQNHGVVSDSHGDSETVPPHVLVYTIPQRGSTVWIMFEGGDAAHPVWMGGLS